MLCNSFIDHFDENIFIFRLIQIYRYISIFLVWIYSKCTNFHLYDNILLLLPRILFLIIDRIDQYLVLKKIIIAQLSFHFDFLWLDRYMHLNNNGASIKVKEDKNRRHVNLESKRKIDLSLSPSPCPPLSSPPSSLAPSPLIPLLLVASPLLSSPILS